MKTIVIVVEDDGIARALCDLVRAVLAETGSDPLQVLPACSLDDVLHILARQHIAVLMVDHDLAGLTGLDLIRWLGPGLTGTAKILLAKDPGLLADPKPVVEPGIDAVLVRPLGKEPLKRALQRCLPRKGNPARHGPLILAITGIPDRPREGTTTNPSVQWLATITTTREPSLRRL